MVRNSDPQHWDKRSGSVADQGCLSRIQIFSSRIQIKKIPDPRSGSASKNLSIFNPNHCFQALKNIFRDVHPGSGSWFFYPSRIPGIRKSPDPGVRIHNTETSKPNLKKSLMTAQTAAGHRRRLVVGGRLRQTAVQMARAAAALAPSLRQDILAPSLRRQDFLAPSPRLR